jgi:DNA topoisomerase VI subunit A
VLLVEKDAVFMRLSEDRFYNDYPWCVDRNVAASGIGFSLECFWT